MTQFAVSFAIPEPDAPTRWAMWGIPIVTGLVAAFLYSLFLVIIAVLAKLGGHDLIDILRDALKPA